MTQQKTPTQMEQEMNAEIFRRNVPSSSLQPYLSVRPASTKYSIMPVVDPRRQLHVPLRIDPTYNMAHTFNPGNATAPWSGYASNVNVESELKNQVLRYNIVEEIRMFPIAQAIYTWCQQLPILNHK